MTPLQHLLRALSVLGCAALVALPASAAALRIDETGTVVSQPLVGMKWRQPVPGRVADDTVQGNVRVDVRLNLQPWLNRAARIYLVLAPVSGERVRVQWTTQGRFMPGGLYTGERALVFDGTAGPAQFDEVMFMSIEADGNRLSHSQNLNFHFEIEVQP